MFYYLILILTYIAIYFILALSLNLIVGFTGQLSLGHAAFFAIGAYGVGVFTTYLQDYPFTVVWLLSALFAVLVAILVGIPILRLRGDYLAIATLGLGEIIRSIIQNWDRVTHGPFGITGIKGPVIGGIYIQGNPIYLAVLCWVVAFLVWWICQYIIKSRIGRAMEAVREDDIAASSVGILPLIYKVLAFGLGAFFAALAGGLWAVRLGSISQNIASFNISVLVLSMVVLGGMGNLWASLVGAALLTVIEYTPQMLSLTNIIPPAMNRVIYGLLLVIMMIYRPQGFVGRSKHKFKYSQSSNIDKAEETWNNEL